MLKNLNTHSLVQLLRVTLRLSRPLVFFDFETHDTTDPRICQIGAIKIFPDGTFQEMDQLINPTVKITQGAYEVHGISDEDVADKPTFRQLSRELLEFFGDSDLAGYNSASFDFSVLCAEFQRVGIDYPILEDLQQMDALRIFYHHAPRNLEAALMFYTGKTLEGAHDALCDIRATMEVALAQLLREKEQDTGVGTALAEVSKFTRGESIDWAGKLAKDEATGEIVFSFGANKGVPVRNKPDYVKWMLRADFPSETKKILREIMSC